MASEQAKELRKQGIAAAKAGQKDQARQLLQQSLRLEPSSEVGWLWLASVARDQRERLLCLSKLLEVNPNNEMALQSLQSLGLTREQLAQQLKQMGAQSPPGEKTPPRSAPMPADYLPPEAKPTKPPAVVVPPAQETKPQTGGTALPASYLMADDDTATKPPAVVVPPASRPQEGQAFSPDIPSEPSNVPIPKAERITELQPEIDDIVRGYLAPPEEYPGVKWVKKSRGRAGERDALVLRVWLGAGALAIVIVIGVIGWNVVLNTPALRGIVFAATSTLTRTPVPPTATFTPTPGVTPTPSPTPQLTLTPSPTVPPEILNGAVNPPRPTDIYPPVVNRPVHDSIALIDRGDYSVAAPTLAVEITLVGSSFNPAPYYYRALALAGEGNLDGARQVLQDAEHRLPEKPNDNFAPLVNAGYAYVDMLMMQKAIDDGQRGQLDTLVSNLEDHALAAIDGDPRLAMPYLALARGYRLKSDRERALGVLDRGLSVPELASNTNLIVEKGQIYFAQKEYDLADYQAFLALYIDPTTETAHLLEIHTALAQGNAGLAVLRAQAYLFYYPGSAEGYKLMADARVMEGNPDLALEAYTQALAGGDNAEVLAARAALFSNQHRYEQARADLTKALNLNDDPQIRAQRMLAAYYAGNLATAGSDAEALLGQGVLPDSEIKLLQARILVDGAKPDDQATFEQALGLLNDARQGSLPSGLQPVAQEYLARVDYGIGKFDDALRAIEQSLSTVQTGSGHYWRGVILEAQGKTSDALREYDWVLSLGQIYPYPFLPDVQNRVAALQKAQPTPTPTAKPKSG